MLSFPPLLVVRLVVGPRQRELKRVSAASRKAQPGSGEDRLPSTGWRAPAETRRSSLLEYRRQAGAHLADPWRARPSHKVFTRNANHRAAHAYLGGTLVEDRTGVASGLVSQRWARRRPGGSQVLSFPCPQEADLRAVDEKERGPEDQAEDGGGLFRRVNYPSP